MKICVFGASGKVGRLVVAQLNADGHEVTAFVHRHNNFKNQSRVTVVEGDIMDKQSVQAAITGKDAVISCLGSWGTKDKNIVSKGMAMIIPAMESLGVSRLITVTGSGAFWKNDRPNMTNRLSRKLLSVIAPKILTDGEDHLQLLAASHLQWTCIRSPVMTNSKHAGYRLSDKLASLSQTIPRRAVVACLVDQLNDRTYIATAPNIYRAKR